MHFFIYNLQMIVSTDCLSDQNYYDFMPVSSIIKIANPLEGVHQLKIYAPNMKDDDTINFLVIVDGQYSIFELNHDGKWSECGANGAFSKEVIAFVRDQIKALYMP